MTRATVTTSKLSLVAGAALILAAFPALAQTNTQTGNAAGGTPTTAPSPGQSSGSSMNQNPGMSPGSNMGSGMHASSQAQGTHQARAPHQAMRARGSDTSQNAAVDRLNEQSYQAAQQGQSFMPGSPGGSSPTSSGDSTGMGQTGGGMSQPNSGPSGPSGGKM